MEKSEMYRNNSYVCLAIVIGLLAPTYIDPTNSGVYFIFQLIAFFAQIFCAHKSFKHAELEYRERAKHYGSTYVP